MRQKCIDCYYYGCSLSCLYKMYGADYTPKAKKRRTQFNKCQYFIKKEEKK